jgi:hypothetical protein
LRELLSLFGRFEFNHQYGAMGAGWFHYGVTR